MGLRKSRIFKAAGFRGQNVSEENFLLELFDSNGVKQDERRKSNTVYWAPQVMINLAQSAVSAMPPPGWVAVGTGALSAPAAQATDKLTAEVARVAMTSKTQTANTSATLSMSAEFGPGVGTGALIEAGIFTLVTANTVTLNAPMFAATSFLVMNKGALDTIILNWDYSLT